MMLLWRRTLVLLFLYSALARDAYFYNRLHLIMAYIDIHTHFYTLGNDDVISIENIYDHFETIPKNHLISTGLHPWYLQDAATQFSLLNNVAGESNVIAIGECGLDKLTTTPWNVQVKCFELQVQLAEQLHKPIIIHCVKAFAEVLPIVKGIKVPVIFHGINNKISIIEPVIKRGYYLSFGKSLLNPSDLIQQTLLHVPLTQLFLETDDSNASIKDIYKSAAEIRNISENEIALQLQKNYNAVFSYAGS